jgi:hypothetical protein
MAIAVQMAQEPRLKHLVRAEHMERERVATMRRFAYGAAHYRLVWGSPMHPSRSIDAVMH